MLSCAVRSYHNDLVAEQDAHALTRQHLAHAHERLQILEARMYEISTALQSPEPPAPSEHPQQWIRV